jgi:hypothetical protein
MMPYDAIWGLQKSWHFMAEIGRPESEDLRVDIAVLLESLIMGSFQVDQRIFGTHREAII